MSDQFSSCKSKMKCRCYLKLLSWGLKMHKKDFSVVGLCIHRRLSVECFVYVSVKLWLISALVCDRHLTRLPYQNKITYECRDKVLGNVVVLEIAQLFVGRESFNYPQLTLALTCYTTLITALNYPLQTTSAQTFDLFIKFDILLWSLVWNIFFAASSKSFFFCIL